MGKHKHVPARHAHTAVRRFFSGAAERNADVGPYVADERGCLAVQEDDGSVWWLSATGTPTWSSFGAGSSVNLNDLGILTANTGAQNTAAWAAVVVLLGTTDQVVELFLPSGTYQFDGDVHVQPANTVFRGAGMDRTVIEVQADIPAPNTFWQMATGATILDLTVDMNGVSGNGICMYEANFCLADHCRVKNCTDYGYWIIDFTGQLARTPVQFGVGCVVRACLSEAVEGFEAFYVKDYSFVDCYAIGTNGIAGGASVGTNGFLMRDGCTGGKYRGCRSSGYFTSSGAKFTNNDSQTLLEADVSISGCTFANSYDDGGAERYCLYLLDLANVRVTNTTLRGTNDANGLLHSATVTGRQELRSTIDIDVTTEGGLPVRHQAGCDVEYRGRLETASNQYLLEIGTNGFTTADVELGFRFKMNSGHAAPRAMKLNDCHDVRFTGARFYGDGTVFQMLSLGAASTTERVEFRGCHFRSARVNSIYGDGWLFSRNLFSNPESATIAAGGYINCAGATYDYYEITDNRWINENGSSTFLFGDTAANKVTAPNFQLV